ncbi:hypothetical protein Nepgr_004744 [Nepenthes gracilis]|uniref:Uncharacterized protein n=1 Tax=Nepenthes gracilis TaxID=150966 RepID=A0AAD3S1Y7_NEPGR|nr:hypothetical protein Nepgr_004744 [Nepenthes gracilis]
MGASLKVLYIDKIVSAAPRCIIDEFLQYTVTICAAWQCALLGGRVYDLCSWPLSVTSSFVSQFLLNCRLSIINQMPHEA